MLRSSGLRFVVLGWCLSLAACGRSSASPTAPTDRPPQAFRIDNEPCVAPATGPVSCRFVADPESSANFYQWRFLNSVTGRGVGLPGPRVSPELDCTFGPGATSFTVIAAVSVLYPDGSINNGERRVAITRAAGACGT
jgi:hypothetical protein